MACLVQREREVNLEKLEWTDGTASGEPRVTEERTEGGERRERLETRE